jgi:hypothetical protein
MQKLLIKARSAVLVFLTHQIALPLLKVTRKANLFSYSKEELGLLPDGTLGKDLYRFLESKKLALLKHYARHDLKHILLQYDTTDEGEVCLQSFMLGNGRVSFPVLATVIFGFVTMPEYWKQMRLAYKQGKNAKPFHGWKWNELVAEQTVTLRNKIFQ